LEAKGTRQVMVCAAGIWGENMNTIKTHRSPVTD